MPARLVRRTLFAAPLVVSLAAPTGCGGAPAPVVAPEHRGPAADPAGSELPSAPAGPGRWQAHGDAGDAWAYVYDDGDQVWLGADGVCRLVVEADCGPDTGRDGAVISCNPPPPQDVQCPPGRPGA